MSETPIPTPPPVPSAEPETPEAQAPVVLRFEFRGSALEFFRIWLANMLLTIATVGLFSPWAKVRTRRYFYGSTFLNGANFDYHASPRSILFILLALVVASAIFVAVSAFIVAQEKMAAVFIELLFLLLIFSPLLPLALVHGLAFNAQYSSHRGARFSFKKLTGSAYALLCLLAVVVLGSIQSAILGVNILVNIATVDRCTPSYHIGCFLHDMGMGLAVGAALIFVLPAILVFSVMLVLSPVIMRAWHNFKARNHSLGPMQFHFEKPPIGAYFFPLWGMLALGLLFALFPFTIHSAFLAALVVAPVIITFIRAASFRLFWNHVGFSVGGESGKFRANFSAFDFAVRILMVNYIAIFLSLGLLYPWAKIHRARFLAENLSLETTPAALEKISGLRGEKEGADSERA